MVSTASHGTFTLVGRQQFESTAAELDRFAAMGYHRLGNRTGFNGYGIEEELFATFDECLEDDMTLLRRTVCGCGAKQSAPTNRSQAEKWQNEHAQVCPHGNGRPFKKRDRS